MKIAQLRLALSRLPELDEAWRSNEADDDLQTINKLLSTVDDLTIADFCSGVRLPKPKVSKPKASRKADINDALVNEYVGELVATQSDLAAFSPVVKRLEKDKRIRVGEAKAIANGYAGVDGLKTKRDAIKAIIQRQTSDARHQHRRSHISDLF